MKFEHWGMVDQSHGRRRSSIKVRGFEPVRDSWFLFQLVLASIMEATEVAFEGMELSRQSCMLAHDSDEYLNAYKLLKRNVGLGNQTA